MFLLGDIFFKVELPFNVLACFVSCCLCLAMSHVSSISMMSQGGHNNYSSIAVTLIFHAFFIISDTDDMHIKTGCLLYTTSKLQYCSSDHRRHAYSTEMIQFGTVLQ